MDLFNGEDFAIKNKFLKELDTAIQAIAVLLTTSSPFSTVDTSLTSLRGKNITDELRPEVAIKVDKVRELICAEYSVIKNVSLDSITEDDTAQDGLIITIAVLTSDAKVYFVDIEV